METNLITSVLKADKKIAIEIANKFKNLKSKTGKDIFMVLIEENLIEVKAPVKDSEGWKKHGLVYIVQYRKNKYEYIIAFTEIESIKAWINTPSFLDPIGLMEFIKYWLRDKQLNILLN